MDQTLLKFVKVLRHADIPVASADSLLAMQAISLIGYEDRAQLKCALGITLAKSIEDKQTLDYCFENFFQQPGQDTTCNQQQSLKQQSPEQLNPEDWQVDGSITTDDAISNNLSALAESLLAGSQTEQQLRLQQAGEAVAISDIRSFTQKGQYSRKMLMQMGLPALQEDIHQLEQSKEAVQWELAHQLKQLLKGERAKVKDFVEQQFLLYAANEGRHLQQETLKKISLNRLEQHHYDDMHKLVRLLAKRLIKKHSRRKRKNRRGRLDVSATLRNNFAYDGILIDVRWQHKRKKPPAVFVICDISSSVSRYARFFLLFLYSLQEVLPQIRSFVFSSKIVEVSDLFSQYSPSTAIEEVNRRWGQAGTDYGLAWQGFKTMAMQDLRQDSVVMVLGDARNNGADPRLDIVREIYQRCGRLVWLNPESYNSWQTGDSEMLRYRSACHQAEECRTLDQLSAIIDNLLVYR